MRSMRLKPGMKLAHYDILAPVGAGGMGEVYRARDARLERDVAIKVVPQHQVNSPDQREVRDVLVRYLRFRTP